MWADKWTLLVGIGIMAVAFLVVEQVMAVNTTCDPNINADCPMSALSTLVVIAGSIISLVVFLK